LLPDDVCLSEDPVDGHVSFATRALTGSDWWFARNQMELRAVSMGLSALQEPCDVSVFHRFEIRAGGDEPAGSALEKKAN
jgi:hypothetical protein